MSPRARTHAIDILADPFHEHRAARFAVRATLLGGEFEFEIDSAPLRRIVAWAFARLPRHRLSPRPPRFRIRLTLAAREAAARRGELPRTDLASAPGLLAATRAGADLVALCPAQRTGLIVVARDTLHSRYHVRYELIEFAVFSLAQRVQGLMPLHAACLGRDGRGILLVGESGAGKSTAALHWLLQGLDFLSEDSVFVEPATLRATAIANFLHIRRDALKHLSRSAAARIARSPTIRRRSGAQKLEIDLRRPEFRLAPRPLRLVGCVFLTRDAARDRELLAPLGRADLAARWQASQPYAASQPGWISFRKRISRLPTFELRRGSHPRDAVEALQSLLAMSSHA
jgi:hypothetical protein